MTLSDDLIKLLSKTYAPQTMVEWRFRGNDVSAKTDDEGNPILMFIGKKDSTGTIKGDRYARTFKKDKEGKIVKDHWERKGKAT